MPTYIYVCECGYSCETRQSIHDESISCEHCGKLMARKPALLGVTFKGDGWGRS